MSDKSRRELLEESFDKLEKEELDDENTQASGEEEITPDKGTTDEGADKSGGEGEDGGDKGSKTGGDEKQGEPADKKVQKDGKVVEEPKPNENQPTSDVKAPNSWTPAERQHWAKIPAEAQKAIQRRELETQRALSGSATARKFTDDFVRTIQPFSHLIRAQNSTPLAAVKNLMTTAAGLTTGNASQKAAIVAEIVGNYGVDIKELDTALAAAARSGKGGGHAAIDQNLAQALQPIYQFMSTIEQGRQQRAQEIESQALESVEAWGAGKDFFEDVREDMADIMEIAAKRGRVITIDKAYEMALNQREDLKPIIDQRKAAGDVSKAASTLARARRAASSVKGAPNSGGGAKPKAETRRGALEQAWDDLSK